MKDAAISFPEERADGAGPRTTHAVRWCIVVQATVWASSRNPVTVLVVPCSTSARRPVGPWDLEIPDGTAGFDAAGVVAYTSLVQPVLKGDLKEHKGDLSIVHIAIFQARLRQLFELQDLPDELLED